MHLAQVLGFEAPDDSETDAAADEIRDQLAAVGISLVDQPDGEVRWHRQ
ncbi:MAG: hypothetical protein AAGD09_22035 [Cyanobacteria bacterium P01_F01_bin.56]